jgi:hypothetical protein
MSKKDFELRTCRWDSLYQGAEVYGYSDYRSFIRVLQAGRVLGASKSKGRWASHPEGLAGSVGPKQMNYVLPMGTITGITYNSLGTVLINPHLGQRWNSVDVWSAAGSAWAKIKFTKM